MPLGSPQEPRISVYDEVAFPSYPYSQSHPGRLATIARLCGLRAPSLDQCRVLELGCGTGGNLLPMAESMPHSEFVGLDLSDQQIGVGQQHLAAVPLPNVRLEARDLLTVDQSIGNFDYIIAHGVFSWTTETVQEKILQLLRDLLTPNGVAYLNYNTYPGWHLQGMLRDMLYFHVQAFADPDERVREARRMIAFLQATLPADSTPLGKLVREELQSIAKHADPFLFHAFLNVVNRPLYFSDLQRRAGQHGVRVFADADPEATWPELAIPRLAQPLQQLTADATLWPQYYDFVRFTNSRRSLLCRHEAETQRGPCWEVFPSLHVAAYLRPAPQAAPSGAVSFVAGGGRTVSTQDAKLCATLQRLSDAWPASVPADELIRHVENVAAFESPAARENWYRELLLAFCQRVVELHVSPSPCSREIAERPMVCAWARYQVGQFDFVTNRRHESVRLSEADRRSLRLLDGTRTWDELTQTLGWDVRESLRRLANASLLAPVPGGSPS